MKPLHAAAFVVAGLAAYLLTRTKVGATLRAAVMPGGQSLPASATPGSAAFVGPVMPANSGVVGSKPAAAFVGPLPFMGPPAPDETVRVSTDYQETPFGWPL